MKHAAWWGSVLHTVGLLLVPTLAHAEEGGRRKDPVAFGWQGSWGLLLEQLASVSYHRFSFPDPEGNEVPSQKGVHVEAFRPDVAVDGFVANHVSVGARVFYQGDSSSSSGAFVTHQTMHVLQVYPRIGFAYSWPSQFGLWAQASIGVGSVWSSESETGATGTATEDLHSSTIAGGLTVLGTYSPVERVVLTAGPWVVTDFARFGDPYMRDETPFGVSVGAGVYL